MMDLFTSAGFGFFGGVVRALVGIMKLNDIQRSFRWKHLIVTLVGSAVIGAFAGILINADYRITALAGYAGTDLLEGLYKIQFMRKRV